MTWMIKSIVILAFAFASVQSQGILYPQESESRELKSLDGIWNFRLAPRFIPDLGFVEEWFAQPLTKTGETELMPVPSSFNDITQKKEVRDHVGWAWYDRTFWVPKGWETDKRIFLRFGAAHYQSIVYVNGIQVAAHSGGALPFLAELESPILKFTQANLITVAINNTLNGDSVPQGSVVWQTSSRYPDGYFTLNVPFDFYNYAGIHRSVLLYSTPKQAYIDDIDVITTVEGTTGSIQYSVKTDAVQGSVSVTLEDKEGIEVISAVGSDGTLLVPDAKLWWPFTMVTDDADAGYLYTFVVTLLDTNENPIDVYRLKVGIRSVKWTNKEILINDKPFYIRGYGRHEDFDVRGKGIDNVMLVKDHNLVKWSGANCYRTSHYPYAEEIMDLADKLGIAIIDEVPAATLDGFGPALLANHKQQMTELIQRDKNRPSVFMWSVGNEPQSQHEASDLYFKEVIDLTRSLDLARRPVTLVVNIQHGPDNVYGIQHTDILSVNRYYSWYEDAGHTETITPAILIDVEGFVEKYDRPVILSEYGADTLSGLHMSPEFVFTEEYQTQLMREHFKAFDYLRKNSSLVGEMIWNFADFMTNQGITRVTGNRKGIFTRDRQPKASAHLLRHRYHLLAAEYDNYPIPVDLLESSPVYEQTKKQRVQHDEH